MTDVAKTSKERVKRHEVLMMSDLQSGAEKVRYVTDADAASLEAEIERLRGDLLLSQNAVSALGRQRADWKAAYEGAIQRNAHETPACAVLQAAEELLEVLPVPNDYYGDEAQTLREALDNARKSSPETVDVHSLPNGIILQRIKDAIGPELFDMQSGATWLQAIEAVTSPSANAQKAGEERS